MRPVRIGQPSCKRLTTSPPILPGPAELSGSGLKSQGYGEALAEVFRLCSAVAGQEPATLARAAILDGPNPRGASGQ